MNSTVSEIVLDINAVGSQASLAMRQYDNKRLIKATLREDGLPYEISNDCHVVFAATKADNTVIFNNARFEDNVIYYDITQQTTAAVGRVKCEFRVYDLENHILTSPAFEIIVDQTATKDIQIESTNEVNTLTQLIAEANKLIQDVNASLDSGGFTPTFAIGAVESLPSYEEAKVTLSGTQKNPILNFGIPRGGNGSEVNHNLLLGLDFPNQHPISVVKGLQAALDGKQPAGDYALISDIPKQYTLPTMSETTKGGAKVGTGLAMAADTLELKDKGIGEGKLGNALLDKINGKLEIQKLWENASPGSDFAGQTITNSQFTDCKFFLISMSPMSFILPAETAQILSTNYQAGSLDYTMSRRADSAGDRIVFADAKIKSSAYGWKTDNSVAKPTAIYGIK